MANNYWLHRISHEAEVSYPMLEKGMLTHGFSDFSNRDFIHDVEIGGEEKLKQYMLDEWGGISRNRRDIIRFNSEMKAGDIVVVPQYGSVISVYRVEEDDVYTIAEAFQMLNGEYRGSEKHTLKNGLICVDGDKCLDLGFARKVELLHKDISRRDYLDARLSARLNYRGTNLSITDLAASVEEAIERFTGGKTIDLKASIEKDAVPMMLDCIRKELNPAKFEKLVKQYFEHIGASTVTIPAKNAADKEGDADVVAVFENLSLVIYTQVKFHQGMTNEFAVIQVQEYADHKSESPDESYAQVLWIVSTADDFTRECKEAASGAGVQLIHGKRFASMLLNAGLDVIAPID